ncbi:CaiB/BaiF CoA transferase family protein [Chloroflexota bacterium]
MSKPLDGIGVVDLSRVMAGPYCTMMLADMGADVIKIEMPGKGDDTRFWGPPFINGESAYFLSINRNKKSLTLDLSKNEGKDILSSLIEKKDIVMENFRPGVMDRLGFGYEQVKKINPGVIFCSISGFGQTGPYAQRPGYDILVQGEGGIMSLTGPQEGPPMRVGIANADIIAGMLAVNGILLALIARGKTGKGQYVDVGMLDGQVSILTYQAGIFFATGENPPRLGNSHPTIAPYELVKTRDGYIILAVGNDSLWQRFCNLVGREELIADERFATNAGRVENHAELSRLVEETMASRGKEEWLKLLIGNGIPCGDIKSVKEVCTDPHVLAREMVLELEHPVAGRIKVAGVPIKLSDTPGAVESPPPLLGEHSEEILSGELGFSKGKIEKLRQDGII